MLTQSAASLPLGPPPNSPTLVGFRVAGLFVAAILGAYCIWVILAQLTQPGVDRLPTGLQSAAAAAKKRSDATWAAWIGFVRGDLWAESAFTFADLLWTEARANPDLTPLLEQARSRIDRAVSNAPTDASVWLLLAGLGLRYHWSRPDPVAALRMSYYTGPNELALMPLRALIAAQLPTLDADTQQLAGRDLHLLLEHQQKSAVVQAHKAATPAGKRFIEQATAQDDSSLARSLRRGVE